MFIFKIFLSFFTKLGWGSIKSFFVKRKAQMADIGVILLIVVASIILTTCVYKQYGSKSKLEQVNAQQEQTIKDLNKTVEQTVQSGSVTAETTAELHKDQMTTEVKASEIVVRKEAKIKSIKADTTTSSEHKAREETITRLDAIQEAYMLTVKDKGLKNE